jgi:hypothetical protein
MLTWDEVTCWRRLEEFCEVAKDKQNANEVNLGHAKRIVEALARHGERCEGRVHDILGQREADFTQGPNMWMGPLAVRLAGRAHLGSTVPLLITRLKEDIDDLFNEECSEALTRIGTPDVLHAIAKEYPGAGSHFRIFATGVLDNIHSDLAVATCLELLGQEQDAGLRWSLGHSLLSHFPMEGIEAARRLLMGGELDFEGRGLRSYLLETCILMGERFPEFDEWLATAKAEMEEHWKKVEELEGDPRGLLLFALEKLTGKKVADLPKAKPSLPPLPPMSRLTRPRQPERKQKVVRNGLCPCGSGKKYRACCGRR